MKNIITSNTVDDVETDWDVIMKKYHFKHLAHVGKSMDIARLIAIGKEPYDYVSDSEDIEEFNDCINDICAKILGIQIDKKGNIKTAKVTRGNITVSDITEGKVEGTLTNKMREQEEFELEYLPLGFPRHLGV
jgi:hypothetical protein